LAKDSLAGIPQAMRDVARREADLDLLARLLAGSFAYPAMLLFMAVTTSYRTDHPYLFWSAAAAILLGLAVRLTVSRFREELLSQGRTTFFVALLASLVLSGGTAGTLLLAVAMQYGFASWPFSLIMLWMAGIASGSTISFTPNFTFLVAQLLLLLGPLIAYECLLGTSHGASIGLATLVFFGFHVAQGRRLHGMYWDLSASRALKRLRITELEEANSNAEHAQKKLHYHATHDDLTGMMNRARILSAFDEELQRALRGGMPLGIVMFDLDNFKEINDRFGHLGGDEVLRTVAARVHQSIRSTDAVGRYGGEEFLLLLPGCDAEKCAAKAELVRQAIESKPVIHEEASITVTGSFGIAVFDPDSDSSHLHMLAKADRALYRAKRKGKNRVEIDSFESSMIPILIQRSLAKS
jgi:diguanylate cyclase (GGDEF)-like protein